MFNSINCTVFDIPLTWNRKSFEASRNKCRQARRLVEASVNAQYNKQLRETFLQKLDVEKNILESQQCIANQERKIRALDNLIDVAAESLDNYFDKRIEHVRAAIQEHCDAIRQILCEENEHWKEIHTVIDQHLITSEDIHRPDEIMMQEMPFANMDTITEVHEEEEQTSKLLNNESVTPLITQMIRKSRLHSNRISTNGSSLCTSTQKSIHSKEERFSVIVPLTSARRTLPVIDTTFVIKAEESKATEPNETYHEEVVLIEPVPTTNVEVLPMESVPTTDVEVLPIESVPTTDVEIVPSYSQPKPPAKLYFSPTLLQDCEEPEIVQPVLSTIDQNQISINKPKIISRRFGQTFLLDNIKTGETNEMEDQENLRPNISDEIPMIIPSKISIPIEREPSQMEESDHQKSLVYVKRKVRAKRTKVLPEPMAEPVHMTRRTIQKQQTQTDTKQRQPRKRKQSTSDDANKNTAVLRKKKSIASPPKQKTTTRKARGRKAKDASLDIPIREPSPLPIIDRSKHYSTRFSTRSHRLNNATLSTIEIFPEEKIKSTRIRSKSMIRTRSHDGKKNNQLTSKTRSNPTKSQSTTRSKSMMATRSRRK